MDVFLKAAAGVLITAVLGIAIARQGKDISLLLIVAVCAMVVAAAVTFLEPVMEFLQRLESLGNLDSELLKILTKAVGIGLLAELTGLICADAGNAALGKAIQILATAAILWMSIPLMTALIELAEELLGAI